MRFLVVTLVGLAFMIPSIAGSASRVDLTGIDVSKYARYYGVLPPTPTGDGFLEGLKSGDVVHIRYALPKKRPISFQLDFHNIVPLNGGGQSYQLQLRRDSATGPVIYDGPATNCYFWASTNRTGLEVADWLTDEDLVRGYLDVYAIAHVTDDPWTMYRAGNKPVWDFESFALEDTTQLRQALAETSLIREKGIRLLPWPRKIAAKQEDFAINARTRILLQPNATDDDLFAAGILRDEIKRISGRMLPIVKGFTGVKKTDIVFGDREGAPKGDQSYKLETDGKFILRARTSTGLFYGVQTAVQLLKKKGMRTYFAGALIDDSPSLRYRMAQYDVARYQTINIPYLKRIVREMGRFKLNQLMLYMENDFRYTKYPFTGKPGTFTPESARELVAYARKYHVEVVPQLEALGHGTRLLSYPEFADLRENGNNWNFCTSNPRTWQVLDDMIGELANCFDNTKFIHLGCDEFEDGFAQCPECKARAAKIGWGGLYAEHLSKLNELAKKHGRTMIFWTSRGGKRPDVAGDLTLKYADLLPKDMIPMEWLYDGFPEYPTIDKLQKAGFKEIFAAPGVMGYAMVNPDCGLSFRSVSTFYRYAVKRGINGGCACTWELAWGSQLETHLYGLIYSGQCGWNTNACGEDAFQRAFAQQWFGLKDADPTVIRKIFNNESLKPGSPIFWANSAGTGSLFWTRFRDLMKSNKVHWSQLVAAAPDMERSANETLTLISKLKTKATRNTVTLDAMATTVRMYRATARKIFALDKASTLYRQAKEDSAKSDRLLSNAIDALKPLRADYPDIVKGFEQARDERGAAPQDVDSAVSVSKSLDDMINKLEAARNGALPPAEEIGL